MKKSYYPVAAAWIVTFLILGINFLIRRNVFPMWVNVYVFQWLVPLGGLFAAATQSVVYVRSLYFLLEKPNKKEALVKAALSLAWFLGAFLPGVSLKLPDIHVRSDRENAAPAPSSPADGGETIPSNRQ